MFLRDLLQITTKRTYTDEGFLIVPATISRTGMQVYTALEMGLTDRNPTDLVQIYRPEDEVFSEKSLSSFANKPVTDNHPPKLVDSKNAKEFSVGHAGPDVVRDGDFVTTILHITDADAISNIESGKVELSNGYTSDIDWTPGVTQDGETYDAIQRNIKGNHIAIVERGRAGASCRVADNLPTLKEIHTMKTILIDGVEFDVSDQVAQAVGKLQARVTDAETEAEEKAKEKDEEIKKKEDEMEEAEAKSKKTEDSLQAQLDAAVSKIPSAVAMDALVSERASFIDSVLAVMPDLTWAGKDNATIKKEVVAAKCPNIQLDSKSSEYINARFDTLLEDTGINSQTSLDNALQHQVTIPLKDADTRTASVIARDKMIKASQNAWNPNQGEK